MCGRFRIELSAKDILGFYRLIEALDKRYRDNQLLFSEEARDFFPSAMAPVLTAQGIEKQSWGFPLDKKLVFNGRSESLREKNLFKGLLAQNRCLVPASLFYEWHEKRKFTVAAQSPFFFMAGLYRAYRDEAGLEQNHFVILTTEADRDVARIHSRMPVILREDRLKDYLSPGTPFDDIVPDLVPWNRGLKVEPAQGEQLSLLDD